MKRSEYGSNEVTGRTKSPEGVAKQLHRIVSIDDSGFIDTDTESEEFSMTSTFDMIIGNFEDYKQLVIKYPTQPIGVDTETFLRVAHFLQPLIKFYNVKKYVIENGIQDQKHMHLIIRKRKMPTEKQLKQIYKKWKKKRYLRYIRFVQKGPNTDDLCYLEYKIDLHRFNYHLSDFQNQNHYEYTFKEYLMKEN